MPELMIPSRTSVVSQTMSSSSRVRPSTSVKVT
jgi:hypothetical protein